MDARKALWTARRATAAAALVVALLLGLAWQRYERLNAWVSRPLNQLTPDRERAAIEALISAATNGSWDSYEKSRSEQVAQLLSVHARTSTGAAVYFFPETLPLQSLERSFVAEALQPGIQSLREAYEEGKPQEARRAYRLLESRVGNYELGASGSIENLSPEARQFLGVYEHFTQVQNARVPSAAKPGQHQK